MINIIAAQAKNGIIGKNGALPWTLKKDMARFKSLTLGNTVIMGAETFRSIGRPLPDRINIILSNTIDKIDGATVCRDFDSALRLAISHKKEIFICGGESVYRQALPIADRVYITYVDAALDGDRRFPAISENFALQKEEYVRDGDFDTRFCVYEKRN